MHSAAPGKLDGIQYYEFIGTVKQAKVTIIREKVRLHNGDNLALRLSLK
jgi:hypothetical protein